LALGRMSGSKVAKMIDIKLIITIGKIIE
jgi:hypothetical protein